MKQGPSNLDIECKASLQHLLKPSHYSVIAPWMAHARTEDKRDMVKLGQITRDGAVELTDPLTAHTARKQPVVVNGNGRARLATSVPCTADRMQHDLFRNRHGSEQRGTEKLAKRQFMADYVPIPSVKSVDDFHRLRDVAVASDSSTKVLTEQARRNLQLWQVRGPEKDSIASAQVMRSLRSISDAVANLPTYHEHSRGAAPGGQGCTQSLHEYGKVVPKGPRNFKSGSLHMSRSAPSLGIRTMPPPYIEPEELEQIHRPVNLFDKAEIMRMKNKHQGSRSQVCMTGGNQEWSTTYNAMVT